MGAQDKLDGLNPEQDVTIEMLVERGRALRNQMIRDCTYRLIHAIRRKFARLAHSGRQPAAAREQLNTLL